MFVSFHRRGLIISVYQILRIYLRETHQTNHFSNSEIKHEDVTCLTRLEKSNDISFTQTEKKALTYNIWDKALQKTC